MLNSHFFRLEWRKEAKPNRTHQLHKYLTAPEEKKKIKSRLTILIFFLAQKILTFYALPRLNRLDRK
jgi:hypothetical protein